MSKSIGDRIYSLRKKLGLSQEELAIRLNVVRQTISKWERGESSPDISALVAIADIFGVTLDYLVRDENIDDGVKENKKEETRYNHRVIAYISQGLVWFIALFSFIITSLISPSATFQWLFFVYALPIAVIVRLVFNSIWFNPRRNYYIISVLMWSILAAIHLTFLYFKNNIWLIYLLGVAGEIIIILCMFIKKPRKTE